VVLDWLKRKTVEKPLLLSHL